MTAKTTSHLLTTARPVFPRPVLGVQRRGHGGSPELRARRGRTRGRRPSSRAPGGRVARHGGRGWAAPNVPLRGVGSKYAPPRPVLQPRPRTGLEPPPAASRRVRSRVAAAADGHRPVVHLQTDGATVLRLQAAVAARGPGWRLPLMRRSHQAAEHRHPGPGHRRRPPSRPARPARHHRDGAAPPPRHGHAGVSPTSRAAAPCLTSPLRRGLTSSRRAPQLCLGYCFVPGSTMCQVGEDYAEPPPRESLPAPRLG